MALWSADRKKLDFENKDCVWRNNTGNAGISIGQMRAYSKLPNSTDPHAFQSAFQARDHVALTQCEGCGYVRLKSIASVRNPEYHMVTRSPRWAMAPVPTLVSSISRPWSGFASRRC